VITMGMMPWENNRPFTMKRMTVNNTLLGEVMQPCHFQEIVEISIKRKLTIKDIVNEMCEGYISKQS